MKSIKINVKQIRYAIFAVLFTIAGILPVGAEELPQAPDEPPAFSVHLEWSGGNGYIVMGTITEFTSDIINIQPMYSLDGLSYQPCENMDWNLNYDPEDAGELQALQSQICLVSNVEPLKSYLAGDLDRFWLKLCISKENGVICETNAAVIDRGSPQPLPEGVHAGLTFSSTMSIYKRNPFRVCGRYQITVSENASPEEIAAYLPDTVPVTVNLLNGINAFTECNIDCPVIWKPFSLASLTAGESVSIEDAAEPVIVPAGTLLHTPLGTFCLDEALGFDEPYYLDEIDLVLNVVGESAAPSGALSAEWEGLELVFHLKPTAASDIQIYVCAEDGTQWTQLPGSFPPDAINSQPNTQNSGYALILDNDTEPYRSYLAQKETGNPTPFFVGVKIKGGVYDGKQLILPWPADYELPLNLPKLDGSGGNENNAGSGDKGDSTNEGQRPDLPENPSGSSGASGTSGSSGLPEPSGSADTPPSDPGSGTQPKPETPDTPDSESSDTMLPDRTQIERPSARQSDQDTMQNTSENPETDRINFATATMDLTSDTHTAQNTVTGDKTYIPDSSVAESKTYSSKNSATDNQTRTPENTETGAKTRAAENTTADNHTHAPENLQQTPNRHQGSDTHLPVLPISAAAACFGICIAAVKIRPKH